MLAPVRKQPPLYPLLSISNRKHISRTTLLDRWSEFASQFDVYSYGTTTDNTYAQGFPVYGAEKVDQATCDTTCIELVSARMETTEARQQRCNLFNRLTKVQIYHNGGALNNEFLIRRPFDLRYLPPSIILSTQRVAGISLVSCLCR